MARPQLAARIVSGGRDNSGPSNIAARARIVCTASRVLIAPADLPDEDAPLGQLLALWESERRGAHLPRRTTELMVGLVRHTTGKAHLLEVGSDDPNLYQFRLWGVAVGLDDVDWTGRRLGDMPHRAYRALAADDYATAVATGVPTSQLVSGQYGHVRSDYSRLILPLAADGRRVDHILVAIHHHRPRDLGALGAPHAHLRSIDGTD